MIEAIYLINLDSRTDRLEKSMEQLSHYSLTVQRVSAVNGKELPIDCFDAVCLKFLPGMEQDWVYNSLGELDYLRKAVYGRAFVSRWTSKGAVGCALSHLSVLRDALEKGYETIWVLEDDFLIMKDPLLLEGYIQELSQLTDWDLLYTDMDKRPEADLEENLERQWRPDIGYCSTSAKRCILNDHFTQIGYRDRTHSLIFSRSGIEKVVHYFDHFGIFLPIDHELGMIPNFKMYNLRDPVVTYFDDGQSDIQGAP